MADPTLAQSPPLLEKLLDSARFPRVAQFIKDPSVENALRVFTAAIPWARDPAGRGVRADDDLYLRSIADWTEEIFAASRKRMLLLHFFYRCKCRCRH